MYASHEVAQYSARGTPQHQDTRQSSTQQKRARPPRYHEHDEDGDAGVSVSQSSNQMQAHMA